MLLQDKSVVITGAGSGVGRASALLFAGEGARVVCADVRQEWADETARLIAKNGGTATAVRCDVAIESDVVAAIETTARQYGRLDVMFNNAGVSTPRGGMKFEDHTIEDFDRLVAINFKGVFLGCKHAVLRFKQQGGGGTIVNTASVAGIVGWGGGVYGATKGAVNQITRVLAIEAAPFDIRVNAICPAAMPTTRFLPSQPGAVSAGQPAETLAKLAAIHPLGRNITPEDCAAAALFLASDSARNITGVLLPVDGGYIAQ